MILVTTAGKVGAEAARLLRERDTPVRVLVRDPGKAGQGAGPRRGRDRRRGPGHPREHRRRDGRRRRGSAGQPGRPAQELNVVASAAKASVAHIVKASSKASPDSPIARRRGQSEIEAGLAAAGIPHTLLRSSGLHAERPRAGPGDRRDERLRLGRGQGPGWHGRRPGRRRGGRARSPPRPPGTPGRPTGSAGRNSLTNYDVAAVLSKLLGRTVTYRELTFEENKDAMIRAGVPERVAEMNAQAFRLNAGGDAEWLSPMTSPRSSAARPAPSGSSPPTTPPRSPTSAGGERRRGRWGPCGHRALA